MSFVTVTIDSLAVETLLVQLAGKASHLQPAMNTIAHDLAENVRLTFRDLKTPEGVPWARLSPVTISRRTNHSSVPLNDTGVLRNSITYNADDYGAEIGTNAVQATTMNFGAKQGAFGKNRRNVPIPWGDIPARQFMPTEHLPLTWEQDMIETLESYLGIV